MKKTMMAMFAGGALAALAATETFAPGLSAPSFPNGAVLTGAALASTNATATATVKAVYTLDGGKAVTNDLVCRTSIRNRTIPKTFPLCLPTWSCSRRCGGIPTVFANWWPTVSRLSLTPLMAGSWWLRYGLSTPSWAKYLSFGLSTRRSPESSSQGIRPWGRPHSG